MVVTPIEPARPASFAPGAAAPGAACAGAASMLAMVGCESISTFSTGAQSMLWQHSSGYQSWAAAGGARARSPARSHLVDIWVALFGLGACFDLPWFASALVVPDAYKRHARFNGAGCRTASHTIVLRFALPVVAPGVALRPQPFAPGGRRGCPIPVRLAQRVGQRCPQRLEPQPL